MVTAIAVAVIPMTEAVRSVANAWGWPVPGRWSRCCTTRLPAKVTGEVPRRIRKRMCVEPVPVYSEMIGWNDADIELMSILDMNASATGMAARAASVCGHFSTTFATRPDPT